MYRFALLFVAFKQYNIVCTLYKYIELLFTVFVLFLVHLNICIFSEKIYSKKELFIAVSSVCERVCVRECVYVWEYERL